MSKMVLLRYQVLTLFVAVVVLFVNGMSVSNSVHNQSKQNRNVTGKILSSMWCSCGVRGNCTYENGEKKCSCEKGYADNNGKCSFCDCGPDACSFEFGVGRCHCKKGFEETNWNCEECDCGSKGTCGFTYDGKTYWKKCSCQQGFAPKDGKCTECHCGPEGTCSFENGLKKCDCNAGFREKEGECTECNCGPKGACKFENGQKKCECDNGFADKAGICAETCYHGECEHGSECVPFGNFRFCNCTKGLSGDKCETIDDCGDNRKFKNCKSERGTCEYDKFMKAATCECEIGKKLDPTVNYCKETCDDEYDCQNGGICNFQTSFCECKPHSSGDYCEIIEGCDRLKCEELNAVCIYDVYRNQSTCKCYDDNYYFENGKCSPEWCKNGCNSKVSRCEYNDGIGVCKCINGNQYYDYSTKTCRQIDPCLNLICGENQICTNGKCKCDDNYKMVNETCKRQELCKTNVCFVNSKCEEDNTFGSVRCLCNSDSQFYLHGKCQDGRCFLPGQRKNCRKSCPSGMLRKEGECKPIKAENECYKHCGFLGWCYRFSNYEKCMCDPNFSKLDQWGERCVLKDSVVCPMGLTYEEKKCNCTGKYKLAENGITCELRSCSDDDVQEECKSIRAKCVDNWKNDIGYKCVCPLGYIYDKKEGCVDPCSLNKYKELCTKTGQKCYTGEKIGHLECRCPPTFSYDFEKNTCESSKHLRDNTFMIHDLPVMREKYEFAGDNINKVLLIIDVIASFKQTFNNLDFAVVYSLKVKEDVIFCNVWLQFNPHLPVSFRTSSDVTRWRFQMLEIGNQLILPPELLLNNNYTNSVEEEQLTFCSDLVYQSVCGTGSICYENQCDCANGFRIIESTVKVYGETRILRCEDIDECSENIHSCYQNTTYCINTLGDYYCQCLPGYKKEKKGFLVMNKKPCVGVCDLNPCNNSTCQILEDYSIYCKCNEGFTGPFCRDRVEIKTKKEIELSISTFFIVTLAFFCILILMLSGTICYVYSNRNKI